jgi:hypothetical protein
MSEPMICTMLPDKKISDFSQNCSDAQLEVVGIYGIEYGVLFTDEDPFWIRIGPITWHKSVQESSQKAASSESSVPRKRKGRK